MPIADDIWSHGRPIRVTLPTGNGRQIEQDAHLVLLRPLQCAVDVVDTRNIGLAIGLRTKNVPRQGNAHCVEAHGGHTLEISFGDKGLIVLTDALVIGDRTQHLLELPVI